MIALFLATAIAALPADDVKIESPGLAALSSQGRPPLETIGGVPLPVAVTFSAVPASATFSLYRMAGAMAAPVVENRPMSPQGSGKTFRAMVETSPAEVPIHYVLHILNSGNRSPFKFDIFAYPADMPERLRRVAAALARDGKNIGLFGPGSTVRRLFTTWKVPCADAGPDSAVAVGDYIGHPLDHDFLPVAAARALFLTTAPQADGAADLVRAEAREGGKIVFASSARWDSLTGSPAMQYRFLSLLNQILPSP